MQTGLRLLPPCCHAQDYTQLPKIAGFEFAFTMDHWKDKLRLFYTSEQQISTLWSLCQAFEDRKQSARVIVDWLNSEPLEKASEVLNIVLPRIQDDERRASLLLSFLYVRPNTWTRCCSLEFCFNCKRERHHDKCDEQEIVSQDLDECLLECRHCRATLLKVEGCSAVTCLCGFAMDWAQERWYRDLSAKQMIPVDIFDLELFWLWESWSRQIQWLQEEIVEGYVEIRKRQVTKALQENKRVLREWISRYIWHSRFSRLVVSQISWAVRKTEIVIWVTNHKALLHQTLGRFAWRHSFSRSVVPVMTEHEQNMRVRWKIAPWGAQLRQMLADFFWRRRNELNFTDLFQ